MSSAFFFLLSFIIMTWTWARFWVPSWRWREEDRHETLTRFLSRSVWPRDDDEDLSWDGWTRFLISCLCLESSRYIYCVPLFFQSKINESVNILFWACFFGKTSLRDIIKFICHNHELDDITNIVIISNLVFELLINSMVNLTRDRFFLFRSACLKCAVVAYLRYFFQDIYICWPG